MNPGLLAIWSDVEPTRNTDYLHWLTREHTLERVGTEGFLAVRVFRVDLPGSHRYLILYDLASPAVLTSHAYLERLNDPTPWSRRIMPTLGNFARGGGAVLRQAGRGQGGHLLALRLDQRPAADAPVVMAIAAEDRICAVRLLDVDLNGTEVTTNEKDLRSGDQSFPGLLLIEALDAEALRDVLPRHAAALAALGAASPDPTPYTAMFALQQRELAGPAPVAGGQEGLA